MGLWAALWLLVTIPGISRRVAEVVLCGDRHGHGSLRDLPHLASWAGLCPGNNEMQASGGAAGRCTAMAGCGGAGAGGLGGDADQGNLPVAQYRRLVRRCGKKKMLVAVAHSMLGMCYQMLKKREPYQELGADYLEKLAPEKRTRQLVRQLESLGQNRNPRTKGRRLSPEVFFHSRR